LRDTYSEFFNTVQEKLKVPISLESLLLVREEFSSRLIAPLGSFSN
jgi:hypothetical protein